MKKELKKAVTKEEDTASETNDEEAYIMSLVKKALTQQATPKDQVEISSAEPVHPNAKKVTLQSILKIAKNKAGRSSS